MRNGSEHIKAKARTVNKWAVEIATPDRTGWVIWVADQSKQTAHTIAGMLREQGYIARCRELDGAGYNK